VKSILLAMAAVVCLAISRTLTATPITINVTTDGSCTCACPSTCGYCCWPFVDGMRTLPETLTFTFTLNGGASPDPISGTYTLALVGSGSCPEWSVTAPLNIGSGCYVTIDVKCQAGGTDYVGMILSVSFSGGLSGCGVLFYSSAFSGVPTGGSCSPLSIDYEESAVSGVVEMGPSGCCGYDASGTWFYTGQLIA
jgi:hypothetical protein